MQIWRYNVLIVLTIAGAQTAIYMTINHWPLWSPRQLPRLWMDDAIPFWPWTLWAYFGFILGQMAMAIAVRERALFHRAIIAYGIAMGVTLFVHVIWPTMIERPDPPPDGKFYTWAYRLLLASDSPNSCFPSAHICGTVVIFWAYWRDGRWLGGWLLFVVLPILTLSILTTKQHYFWDWLGGWGMGIIGIAVSALVKRGSTSKATSTAAQSPDPRTVSAGD